MKLQVFLDALRSLSVPDADADAALVWGMFLRYLQQVRNTPEIEKVFPPAVGTGDLGEMEIPFDGIMQAVRFFNYTKVALDACWVEVAGSKNPDFQEKAEYLLSVIGNNIQVVAGRQLKPKKA